MIKIRYKTFQTSEEFEEWQGSDKNIMIAQMSPILLEINGATKTHKVEKGDENCRINMGSLPYGIFVIYYFKQSI